MTEPRKIDWNDLHCEFGLEAVREQLLRAAANDPVVRQAGQPDVMDDLPRPHLMRQPLEIGLLLLRGTGRVGHWRR